MQSNCEHTDEDDLFPPVALRKKEKREEKKKKIKATDVGGRECCQKGKEKGTKVC